MANSADPDQLAEANQLIWIYTVCKGRIYPSSAGQGLTFLLWICFSQIEIENAKDFDSDKKYMNSALI